MAQVLAEVGKEAEAIAREVVQGLRATVPAYRDVPEEQLLPGVHTSVGLGVRAVAERRLPTEAEGEALAEVAESRAVQGFALEAVLAAYRLGAREVWARVETRGRARGVGAELLLEAARLTWAWADAVTGRVATAHRRAEVAMARHDQQQRANFLRALLAGSLSPEDVAVQAAIHDLDFRQAYVTIRARPRADTPLYALERALLDGPGQPIFFGIAGNDLAGLAAQAPTSLGLPATVGLGPPAELGRITDSFGMASRVLATAVDFGLDGVYRLEDLGPLVAVATDAHLGPLLVIHYLEPLLSRGPRGETLLATLRAYLDCGCGVEATAASLHVHPNTLRYRLNQIRVLTGADLNSFQDLVGLWWAVQRHLMPRAPRQ